MLEIKANLSVAAGGRVLSERWFMPGFQHVLDFMEVHLPSLRSQDLVGQCSLWRQLISTYVVSSWGSSAAEEDSIHRGAPWLKEQVTGSSLSKDNGGVTDQKEELKHCHCCGNQTSPEGIFNGAIFVRTIIECVPGNCCVSNYCQILYFS